MRLQYLLIVLFLACFGCFSPIYAALDLELTQGMIAAIPVAIMPFSGSKTLVSGNETLTQVITNDLQNSGQLRVIGAGGQPQNPQDPQHINYAYWRKQGVNDVVMGVIRPLAGNRYQVAFTLIGVFNSAATAKSSNNILLSQSFQVGVNGLRNVAHHISDLIYQKLTGVRGIFSTKIAYVLVQRSLNKPAKYALEVADADGFNPQALLVSSQPIMSPVWSPDGKRLAYVSFENHHAAIYIQDLTAGQRQLFSAAPGINGAPAFSPDGKYLALVLTKTGNPKIYIMNLATRRLRQITFGWSIDTEPTFALDGKSMLFTSNRDGTPQIYDYAFSTGKITRVTYSGNYNARPSFMPDEQSIIMMHRQNNMFGIARQNLASSQVQVLVQTGSDESPSLAPNGKMVIYATKYGGRGVLAQVSTDGRIKLRLPAREGSVQEPAWSPFLNSP